jgi:predicted membrane channel-forming protein YqfA (hemolysin III family)
MRQQMIQRTHWTSNRLFTLVLGIVFTLVGTIGFFVAPGITKGNLLSFDVDLVHNIFHLLTGIAALVVFFTSWSRLFNRVLGIVYLLIGFAGLVYPGFYIQGFLLGVVLQKN